MYWLLTQFWIYWEQVKENNNKKNLMELMKKLSNSSFYICCSLPSSSVRFTFEHSIYIL